MPVYTYALTHIPPPFSRLQRGQRHGNDDGPPLHRPPRPHLPAQRIPRAVGWACRPQRGVGGWVCWAPGVCRGLGGVGQAGTAAQRGAGHAQAGVAWPLPCRATCRFSNTCWPERLSVSLPLPAGLSPPSTPTPTHTCGAGAEATMGLLGQHTWKFAVPQGAGVHHALNPNPYRGRYGNDGPQYAADIADLIQAATPGGQGGFACVCVFWRVQGTGAGQAGQTFYTLAKVGTKGGVGTQGCWERAAAVTAARRPALRKVWPASLDASARVQALRFPGVVPQSCRPCPCRLPRPPARSQAAWPASFTRRYRGWAALCPWQTGTSLLRTRQAQRRPAGGLRPLGCAAAAGRAAAAAAPACLTCRQPGCSMSVQPRGSVHDCPACNHLCR
jgi:hypothetical protein